MCSLSFLKFKAVYLDKLGGRAAESHLYGVRGVVVVGVVSDLCAARSVEALFGDVVSFVGGIIHQIDFEHHFVLIAELLCVAQGNGVLTIGGGVGGIFGKPRVKAVLILIVKFVYTIRKQTENHYESYYVCELLGQIHISRPPNRETPQGGRYTHFNIIQNVNYIIF